MSRERGIPERINRTSLGAMMARGPLPEKLRLFPRSPLPPEVQKIDTVGPKGVSMEDVRAGRAHI